MNRILFKRAQDAAPDVAERSASLHKGARWWRSRIGAPLAPDEARALPRPGAPEPDLLAPIPPAGRHRLSLACQAVEILLPAGYVLRGLGSAPTDRAAIYHHWAGLERGSLYLRFFAPVNDHLLRKRASEADFANPRFAGIFDALGQLACLAEWAWDPERPEEAEAAFSTSPDHRRRGLAKVAAAACAIEAREAGAARLRIDTLRENQAAQGLARSLGGARAAPSDGRASEVVSSLIELAAPGYPSIESRLGLTGGTDREAARF